MEFTANLMGYKAFTYPLIIITTSLACAILIKVFRKIMNRSIYRASTVLNADPTKYTFLKNTVSALIIGLGIVVVFQLIPELRQFGLPIFASAGVITAIVAFASQQALSNIVGGVFIVIFKPFRVGDLIKVNSLHIGTVEDINLRHTVIRDFDNSRIVIPNALMNSQVIENLNIGDEKICVRFEVGISYTADVDKALNILQSEAENHPLCIDNRSEGDVQDGLPKVKVRVVNLAESAIIIRAWIWTANPDNGFAIRFDMFKTIKKRFDEEGIEIPFPQRTVHIKNSSNN
jgi:small-conductance mechanosensitive channel